MDHSRIEDETRRQVAEFLPRALKYALGSYEVFLDGSIQADIFSKHHTACKVAVAHIQLLIKLAQWADLPDPDLIDTQKSLALHEMIRSAGEELDDLGARLDTFTGGRAPEQTGEDGGDPEI